MRLKWGWISAGLMFLIAAAIALGIARSPLFDLSKVEYAKFPTAAPLTVEEVESLAEVPTDRVSLLTIDLGRIEERIKAHPWVKSVEIQKKFPNRLWIQVHFREPWAILRSQDGTLFYLEGDGNLFGPVETKRRSDLPLMTGISESDTAQLEDALQLLKDWNASTLSAKAQLSSVHFDSERGYRLAVTYAIHADAKNAKKLTKGRSLVELGHGTDAFADLPLKNLQRVFEYLGKNPVRAHQIFVGDGKKIVVRAGRRS